MASSRSSVRSTPPDPFGSETPRLFTKPLRKLTPTSSAGFAVIEFATSVLNIDLYPWQKWLAVHALELLPDGTFRFRTVLLLVARQQGKSTFLQVLALYFLYVRGVDLVIGTAQNLDIAEEVWQGAVDIAENVPELAAEIEKVTMVNGKKALELRNGERYKVQAASRRGGRGLAGDLVLLDELREHQTWDSWSAVTKTTMARPLAQVWAASNAGDDTSVVLSHLRDLGRAALSAEEVDEEEAVGLFEWSAPEGCDLDDPAGIAQANPSLGYGLVTLRAIASARGTDPEPVYRTEVLCQWVDVLTPPAIDPATWATLAAPGEQQTRGACYGVATAVDRSWSCLAAAWRRADGVPQLSVVRYAQGTAWVAEAVRGLRPRPLVDVASRGLVPDATEVSQADQAKAHNALADAVVAGQVRHDDDPEMTVSVRASQWRPLGDTRILDRKGTADISPLVAASLALQALSAHKPKARVINLGEIMARLDSVDDDDAELHAAAAAVLAEEDL